MWTRGQLKENGKKALHRNYWIVVIATLVLGIISGNYGGVDHITGEIRQEVIDSGQNLDIDTILPSAFGKIGNFFYSMFAEDRSMYIVAIFCIVWALIVILFSIFIGNLFEIGGARFFEENSDKKAELGLILYGFQKGSYVRKTFTLFLRDLYIFLWGLLLIIPGIIKNYEYSMIPYILAENPEISRQRAFEISKKMMDGQKMDAFVLDLSFIGWEILGAITFGIVKVLYVHPYEKATWVELYKVNRKNMLETGKASIQELPGWNGTDNII